MSTKLHLQKPFGKTKQIRISIELHKKLKIAAVLEQTPISKLATKLIEKAMESNFFT